MSAGSEEGQEDIEFLKDQVQRLNALLSQYQRKYLPVTQEDAASVPIPANGPHASWLTNKRLLAPIVLEYDQTINELNKQITIYQSELENLSSQVQQITEENSRLHTELRRTLEAQLEASTGGGSEGEVSMVVANGLQQQVDMLSKERDSYIDLWKQTTTELKALQKSQQSKTKDLLKCQTELVNTQQAATTAQQTLEEMQAVCQQLDEERTRCLKTAKEQEKEVDALQDNLSQTRTELKAAGIKNGELKQSLDDITLQLKRREAERQRIEGVERTRDDRIHLMQLNNADLEGKLLVSQREAALLKEETTELQGSLAALQTKASSLEQREREAILHVKESVEIVETALMEKDQAQIREQQLTHEIARLKRAIDTIVREAGERTSREVTVVREECNKSIDKMAAEIHKLEEECGERQAVLERVQREKRMVEKELEKALSQKPVETQRTGETLHELHRRVCVAERARDDVLLKFEGATASLKRAESNLEEERKASEQLEEEFRKRHKKFVEEMEQLKENKLKVMNQCEEFQQKLRLSEQSREATEMRLVREIATLAQRHNMKEKELLFRLESSEEAHCKSVQELRDMLSAQHRVGTRWKEESRTLSRKFEQTLAEVKGEMTRYKRSSEELQVQLSHMKATKKELGKQLGQMTNTNAVLQHQLGEVEAGAESAAGQVSALISKEKQLLQERRELHKQLDRMRLQVARNAVNVDMAARAMAASTTRGDFNTSKLGSLHPSPGPSPEPRPNHTSFLVDTSNWNTTLTELRQSIQQVREDLATSQRGQPRRGHGHGARSKDKDGHLSHSDDDLDISEQSLLSRSDLSPHTSHSALVHS